MNTTLKSISRIIERESKASTYKFALLRGTIDIIQESSPYIIIKDDIAYLPMGLLVERWMLYYYPIFESGINIPQINGAYTNLAFRPFLVKVIDYYRLRGGFSVFYSDLRTKGLPNEVLVDFNSLVRCLISTIARMPMKFIGTSITNQYYTIFNYHPNRARIPVINNSATLISNMGTFSIPLDYYDAFKLLGSFIAGQESILFKWAEFSVKASNNTLDLSNVLNSVLKAPITEREVREVVAIYKNILVTKGNVKCVWTGSNLRSYHIDHLIPFSLWKNNDLWNLLPSSAMINNNKRDKIPSPEIIYQRKDSIIDYWELLNEKLPERFQREFQISLIGETLKTNWQHTGIENLQRHCNYLISDRGYEMWNL